MEALMVLLRPVVFAAALQVVRNVPDAEDVAHDTLRIVLAKLVDLRALCANVG